MTSRLNSFLRSDIIHRFVCFVLGIISVSFAAILRYQYDKEAYKVPFTLAIIPAIFFVVELAMSIYIWSGDVPFCPKRAFSLTFLGVIAMGCAIGCAVSTSMVNGEGTKRLENALTGMLISAIILEAISVARVGYTWATMSRSTPVKQHYEEA